MRNDVYTKYSFDNLRFIFYSKILQFHLKNLFTITINLSQWQTLKITRVELGLDCFSKGSFTWYVPVVSSPQNLVILPSSSKMVRAFLKRKFRTYSNYSPLVLSLGVFLRNTSHATGSFCLFLKAHIPCKIRRGQINIYIEYNF